MASKEERYFTGRPVENTAPDEPELVNEASVVPDTDLAPPYVGDPSKPLPGEVPPGRKKLFITIGVAIGLVALGTVLGLAIAPEPPAKLLSKVAELEITLDAERARADELERSLAYQSTDQSMAVNKLAAKDRQRHEMYAKRYSKVLRQVQAQSAAELVEWFVNRWDLLLDRPEPDDRVTRRAATLSLLVGGMARNLNPDDYVPWQAEFLHNANWLGDLHFDLDGDGLPAPRSSPNPKDGFANVSVCHIAMALNQSVTDAQILVASDMECDRPENRMSVFLQGRTLNDAITEFVHAVRREGFIVKEKNHKKVRMVILGKRRG